jgi:Trypsin-like peptidase domain
VTATAVSVLRPDMLVTAKHVFFKGKRAVAPFGSCSFRSYSRRKAAIPVLVQQDQRKGYVFNNEDFVVVRLKRALEGCSAFAISDSDSSLREEEELLSVTGRQLGTLNKLSNREPVVAKGKIKRVLDGVLGGPPFYYTDIDFDVGGSGGAVFGFMDGRPVADDEGRLVLRGISVAYDRVRRTAGPTAMSKTIRSSLAFRRNSGNWSWAKPRSRPRWNRRPVPTGGPKTSVISVPFTGQERLRRSCGKARAAAKRRPAAIARRSPKDWNWPHRREQNQDPCNGNDCNKTIG